MEHAAEGVIAPWDCRRIRSAVLLNGVGLALVAIGWYGSSGESVVSTQIAWVNLAAAGSVVVAVANGTLLLAGRRRVALRTRAHLGAVGAPEEWPPATARRLNGRALRVMSRAEDTFVATDTMRWYHRSECLCAAGKAVAEAGRATHERLGRQACRVCRP